MTSELNTRQWALYQYLKDRGDRWTYQLDIVLALNYYYNFTDKPDKFHDSKARHLLTSDIREINNSAVIQKIIMSSSKGNKIANESEFNNYISREISSALARLNRAKRKAEKGSYDGQMRMVLNQERDTVEAFLRDCADINSQKIQKTS